MKIITLVGCEKSGKTTLIWKLYRHLCGNIFQIKYFRKEGKDKKDFKTLIKYGNKRIAFCSIGDPADINEKKYKHISSEYIMSGLVFASSKEADILINAYSNSNTNPFPEFNNKIYEGLLNGNTYVPIPMKDNLSEELQENQQQQQFQKILGEI